MGGDADRDKNKKLTVAELENCLNDKVPYTSRRLNAPEQKPVVSGDRAQVMAQLK